MMATRSKPVLLAFVLWMSAMGPTFGEAGGRGLGARPPTPEEQAYVEARRVDIRSVEPNALSLQRVEVERQRTGPAASASAVATRPAAVDNTALPWFPPIGSQGYQNSCVAWAAGYYYNTYTQAMDAGMDVSQGDPDDLCSPAFLYPLLNDGVDEGAYLDYAMARMSVIGCSSLALAPYDEEDYTSWPSEAAWVNALDRRTENPYRIQTNTAAGLEAAEQLLANGRLAVVLIDTYANLYYDYPADAPGINNGVLYCPGGPYIFGHALTLVGYSDTKTYRDDRDGLVHQGAFLAANSWGTSWGTENPAHDSQGFVWIAYDAFLGSSRFVYDALYTDDRADYTPVVYALVALSHPQRGYLELRGGVGLPGNPDGTTDAVLDRSGGTKLGLTSSSRIAVDLTDLCELDPDGRLADVFVSLTVSPQASTSGVIATVEFHADADGDGSYEVVAVPHLPVTVNTGATGYGFLPLFTDLTWDQWAYEFIEACSNAGIVGGYSDGTYRPSSPVDRAAMAVYISRALAGGDGDVPAGPTTPTFADVPVSNWAYKYIEYAVANHIVGGYSDGYRPTTVVDRGQMAVFIARSIVTPLGDEGLASYTPPATPTFADVGTSFWAYKYVEYIASQGIANGYEDSTYRPATVCTRDQMAVYVARAFALSG